MVKEQDGSTVNSRSPEPRLPPLGVRRVRSLGGEPGGLGCAGRLETYICGGSWGVTGLGESGNARPLAARTLY